MHREVGPIAIYLRPTDCSSSRRDDGVGLEAESREKTKLDYGPSHAALARHGHRIR